MGKGAHMKGRPAWNEDTRKFLQTVPNIQSSIDAFHAAATSGDMASFERHLVSDRRLVTSRDGHGRTALHKAARAGHTEIVEKLLNGDLASSTALAQATDRVSLHLRNLIPLHYLLIVNNASGES